MKVNLQDLKKISILEYAREIGFTPVMIKEDLWSLNEHDSVRITPSINLYHRFSTGKGGSIIDFVQEFSNVDFSKAIKILNELQNPSLVNYSDSVKRKSIDSVQSLSFKLPEKDTHMKNVFAYLCKQRMIDGDVVSMMIQNKLLYQDTYRNAVFVGWFKEKPYFATKVGTNPANRYKLDVEDSFKEVGIFIENSNSNKLKVFEAPIDAMSYMTLKKLAGEEYLNCNYLIGGCTGAIPNSILFNLAHRGSHIEMIDMCVDNDKAGLEIISKARSLLSESHPEISLNTELSKLKDWNDDLKVVYSYDDLKVDNLVKKEKKKQLVV